MGRMRGERKEGVRRMRGERKEGGENERRA